ncbi:MAG: fibronectin type III domain-containing protein, partial [Nitrospirae bacterium]|nr:fibronectin type III domain-containing protein [Nitrospirota bacterium]
MHNLPTPELLSRIEINWLSDSYAGKDYEIQAWSGYAWITQKKVIGNVSIVNAFDFKPSYRTDKIRIQITDVLNTGYYKQAGISAISLFRDNLITGTFYNDLSLSDGKYSYSITAVDYYGFESLPSESSTADIGDLLPPAAPIELAATVSGADIILTWVPNTEPDLQGYHIYRNTSQGWIKLSTSLIPANTFTDPSLVNNTYSYRVTAVDSIGNE